MHGSLAGNLSLLTALRAGITPEMKTQVAVCVPFPYLAQARSMLAGCPIAWGAQDVSEHTQGAYTGEISAGMLQDLGCRYTLVGHSERRAYHHETDEQVAAKAEAALKAALAPIICVGETLEEREADATTQVVTRQLDAVIVRLGTVGLAKSVIAYEPVWAIGTGKTATPQQAQAVHAMIRARIAQLDSTVANKLQILYGGSMKPANAKELIGQPDIDGGLIGGAALVAADFLVICNHSNNA